MQLNEPMETHDAATTSFKVVLLIFAIVLVGALGYLVGYQNKISDDVDYSATPVKKTATTKADDQAVDCGDKAYAFSLTFGDLWTGYKVKEVKPDYAIITCYFEMPTTSTDAVWTTASTDHDAKYASLFAVSVYTPAQWTAAQEEANKPTKLGENGTYVWGWAPAQAYPDDLAAVAADVKNVVKTFKIVK